ncbi:MAG: hypothetical protein GTN93_23205, partial [Anaerolineae bacterium]|nr:hypothetical protein [Anaerolineae bacterium]
VVDLANNKFTKVKDITDSEAKKNYGPSDTGEPERYTLEGRAFTLWPRLPDKEYLMELSYKSRLKRVSNTLDTNEFMD